MEIEEETSLSTNKTSLLDNLSQSRHLLHELISEYDFLRFDVVTVLEDLIEGISECMELCAHDAKKMYPIVLEKLYDLKYELQAPMRAYFGKGCRLWELYRTNMMQIRAVLTVSCGIPKLPTQTFQRQFVRDSESACPLSTPPADFLPNEVALDKYLAEKAIKLRNEHKDLAAMNGNKSPVNLTRNGSHYFRIKIQAGGWQKI